VRHVLPPDLPIPEGTTSVVLRDFKGADEAGAKFAPAAKELLADRLKAAGLRVVAGENRGAATSGKAGAATQKAADLAIDATVYVETQEAEGSRDIRQYDRPAGPPQTRPAATFVRKVNVRVDFEVVSLLSGERLGGVETRERYDSLKDSDSRGKLGLSRPDDPQNVPAADAVVRGLLKACAATFCRMITPPEVTATVRLRAVSGPAADRGTAAARRGDYAEARRLFEEALAEGESAALHFDLAAVEEATGDLKAAVEHYEWAAAHWPAGDAETEACLRRVRRVMERMAGNGMNPTPSSRTTLSSF
jgi:tetratricopeptide (TPR) repeat protein